MSHDRKKAGQRKDKKNARMREDTERRHQNAGPERPDTDQWDIQTFKPGSANDKNRLRHTTSEGPP